MKNKRLKHSLLYLLFILLSTFYITGCKKKEAIPVETAAPTETAVVTEAPETEETSATGIADESTPLTESKQSYQDGDITINYPVLSGFSDQVQEEKCNILIKDFATAFINRADSDEVTSATVDYQIINLERQSLTVRFTGEMDSTKESLDLEYYLTLDLRNGVTKRLFHYVDPYQLGEMILDGEVNVISDNSNLKNKITAHLATITLDEYQELFKAADFDVGNPTLFPQITSYDAGGPIIFTFPLPSDLGGYTVLTFTPDTK